MKNDHDLTPTSLPRRKFIAGMGTIGLLGTIPRVFAAENPSPAKESEKIRLVHIGCGTQGLEELDALLRCPDIEIVGVADPNRESYDYIHWSETGLINKLRGLTGDPNWKSEVKGIPGGRMIMKDVIERYYRRTRPDYNGTVAAEEDYRVLLDKLKDVDAVKIMSPDFHHAYQAIDCLRRGKHVIMHKPLGNKMIEAMQLVDLAKSSPLSTHMMAHNSFAAGDMNRIKAWIDAGAIGKLREVHNWTNRPVWPQYPVIPTEKPPVPDGLNWDLWLGPAQMRDYHPYYTWCTFRGWYEFGAGAIADMGYYSLWPVFEALKLDSAVSASTRFSRVIGLHNNVPSAIVNDYSYPMAAAYRFEVPYKDGSGKIILQWHDGGMKPPTPDGYENDDLPIEGMMFLGDKGAIVSGFLRENPKIVGSRAAEFAGVSSAPVPDTNNWLQVWIDGCRGKGKGPGAFEYCKEVNETFNLGSVSLMCQGKKLEYDSKSRKITNDAQGDKLLRRDVRKGWESAYLQ
ncbi:MAG: Gfo/Idh/MocA family oxidoreductase [Planctomycetaceae bacterium]|nr:Gfo/Idh/MocA family oxidoreductase [Planctomycetaceae bacterium]